MYDIQMAKDVNGHFSRPGKSNKLVFFELKRCYPIPRGILSAGALNRAGWEKFTFELMSRYILETEQNKTTVPMVC